MEQRTAADEGTVVQFVWMQGLFLLKDGFGVADDACDVRHVVGAVEGVHEG